MRRVLLLFLLSMAVQPAIGKGDTSWITVFDDKECRERLEDCFDEKFFSEDELEVVQGAFLYLDNISVLASHYDINKFLSKLAVLSKNNKEDLFLLEAMIYYHGEHVEQDLDKASNIIENSDFFNKNNPDHLKALGKIYYIKFMTTGKENKSYYEKAKGLLFQAYSYDERYATRALAILLIRSHEVSDFKLAGKLFKFFAENGSSVDKKRYQIYLETVKTYPYR